MQISPRVGALINRFKYAAITISGIDILQSSSHHWIPTIILTGMINVLLFDAKNSNPSKIKIKNKEYDTAIKLIIPYKDINHLSNVDSILTYTGSVPMLVPESDQCAQIINFLKNKMNIRVRDMSLQREGFNMDTGKYEYTYVISDYEINNNTIVSTTNIMNSESKIMDLKPLNYNKYDFISGTCLSLSILSMSRMLSGMLNYPENITQPLVGLSIGITGVCLTHMYETYKRRKNALLVDHIPTQSISMF